MSTKDAVIGSSAAAIPTGRPPATADKSNDANNKKILHQKRWVCDVCKVKWFLDFNEACRHEEQCKGVSSSDSLSIASDAASKSTAKASNDCTKAKIPAMSAEVKNDGASPTITPPPQSKKAAAILAAARARARGIPPPAEKIDKDVAKKSKSVDIEILSDSSDDNNNAVNVVELVDDNSGSRRKTKRLRDATPPAKSNHDSSSSNEMDGKKKKAKATVKATKPTAKKPNSKKSGKAEKKGGPIASIFLPKSQQPNTNNNAKKRAVEISTVPSKKRNQTSTKSTKREVLEIDSSSDDDDDEVVVVQKTTKKSKKNVVLGLSKAELQEHQAADFFARRKKKAEEERERQKKRDEARLARLTGKDVSSKSGLDAGKVSKSSNVTSSTGKVSATANAGAAVTKKISLLQSALESSKDMKGIPAPKFPCPSHIVPCSEDSVTALSLDNASSIMLSKTPRYQYSKPEMTASFCEGDDMTMPLGFLDKSDLNVCQSDIFSSVFECSASHINNKGSVANQLWVDKYTMKKIPEDVIGEENKEASKKLVDFVEEWKVRRHKAIQSMGQVKRKKKKRKKKKDYHGYDDDDGFLDDGVLESAFLISGPTGSGKTRLVHAVAEQCECVVIEINTSEQRSGQALKRAVQETTQSHSSLAMSKRKPDATGFFDNSADDLVDSDSDRYYSEEENEEKEDGHSLTIILIDEVDLLFDEDNAFWPALAQLSQKAKCPIVLTATSEPPQLYYNSVIRYKDIQLRRPFPAECCAKIDQVRKSEGLTLRDGVDRVGNGLSLIAEAYECDLRKILNEMQVFRYQTTHPGCSDHQLRLVSLNKTESDASVFSDIEESCPVILDIQPRILPRDRYSVLTIEGRNLFQSELFIGDQPCKNFAVVSDSKIIAVCPPCSFPEGVTRDAIYKDDQHLDCLSSKFAEVVLRKKCPNSGLVLGSSSHSIPRTNWNVEYDIPLRESKFDQQMSRQAFIRESKAKLKRQQNQHTSYEGFMSSEEEEFEKNEEIDPSEQPLVEAEAMAEEQAIEAEIEMSEADAQALLDEALSNIDISPYSPNKEKMVASTEALQQNALELSAFANEVARFSDASLLESSFSSHVPSLSGAVEGFGYHLFDADSSESDPTIDKLSKGKNNKPPCFDTLHRTGANESGFFFGDSDSYFCNPNRPRERKLLCLSEMNSRGLGRLDIELKEEVIDADSNSGFGITESDSLFPPMPTRSNSEDDILLSANLPSTFLLLPSLLIRRRVELLNVNYTLYESPLLDLRRSQVWRNSMHAMYDLLTHGKSWCFDLRHGENTDEEMMQQKAMTVAGGSPLGSPLALDYLPYLREICLYENKARSRVQEMMKQNGEVGSNKRKTRSSKRNLRRHYLEEFYPGRFEGKIDAISSQLALSYMR